MAKVLAGQTASGIIKELGTTPEEFLKANPSFAAKGGKNDYQGLSGDIQVGQEYNLPGTATIQPTITPVQGSGTYAEDLTKSLDTTGGNATAVAGTSDALRAAERKKEVEKIKTELSGGLEAPAVYKSVDEFTKLRTDQGIVQDESELSAIQNEAALAKEELRKLKPTAGEGVSEAGRIGAMTEAERNVNFKLEGLALRENAVVNRLNTKNSYINTVLNLKQQDYNTALTNYNNEYTKTSKAVELYNTQLSDTEKDAMTGFTTITNLLKDNGVDMTKLSPALKAQITTLETQAGLPSGTFEAFASAMPDAKILSPISVDNADGSKSVYFFIQDEKTGQPTLIKTLGLGGVGTTPSVPVNPELSGIIGTILGSGKFTKQQANDVRTAINSGEDPLTVIKNQAKSLMTGANQTKVENYEVAKNAMLDVQNALTKFYEAKGSTGIFEGNYEKVVNKLGEVDNPALVDLATQIQTSLQVYRNAVSGTAYSVQEGKDIASIFPGINKTQGLNQAILNGRMKAFDSTIDGAYEGVLGSAYNKVKNADTSSLKEEDVKYTLESVAGSDGKVSPDDWKKMKQMFIDAGGTADAFNAKYSSYKNPNNPYYQ